MALLDDLAALSDATAPLLEHLADALDAPRARNAASKARHAATGLRQTSEAGARVLVHLGSAFGELAEAWRKVRP
jgi:hypothetical protein